MHTLDLKSHHEGYTPFHLAVLKADHIILRYIVQIYKQRDYIRHIYYQGMVSRKSEYTFE